MAQNRGIFILAICCWLTALLHCCDAFIQPQLDSARRATRFGHHATTMKVNVEGRRGFISNLLSGTSVGLLALNLRIQSAKAGQAYLTEPTAEFKAMEAKQSEFAKEQRAYKMDFNQRLEKYMASQSSDDAINSLNSMTNAVRQRGGLPESIRINDLLKTCRKKKAQLKESGKWTTDVQIAYETLVQTTNKTVVPLQSGA